ncbi:MAG: hypothetical protein MPJ50_17200 [Pirellulales bacterium]|nr:hypothetical protein [Pirellulales bacterium]
MTSDADLSPAFRAGRLIHWGLNPKETPATQQEYKDLLDNFMDDMDFQCLVHDVAAGMELRVLDWGDHGIVLSPTVDSVFAMRGASFRKHATTDERLLDGLIQVAIAATIFPTSQDLEQEATLGRSPLTLGEVEETLHHICTRMAEKAKTKPDPIASDEEAELHEAWRVYLAHVSDHKTKSSQSGPKTIRRFVERNLAKLQELGCLRKQADDTYQSTWRYHVLVQELAASEIYQQVLELPAVSDAERPPSCPS